MSSDVVALLTTFLQRSNPFLRGKKARDRFLRGSGGLEEMRGEGRPAAGRAKEEEEGEDDSSAIFIFGDRGGREECCDPSIYAWRVRVRGEAVE